MGYAVGRHECAICMVEEAPLYRLAEACGYQDRSMKPRIGLLAGDPSGIGPEVAAKLLAEPRNTGAGGDRRDRRCGARLSTGPGKPDRRRVHHRDPAGWDRGVAIARYRCPGLRTLEQAVDEARRTPAPGRAALFRGAARTHRTGVGDQRLRPPMDVARHFTRAFARGGGPAHGGEDPRCRAACCIRRLRSPGLRRRGSLWRG